MLRLLKFINDVFEFKLMGLFLRLFVMDLFFLLSYLLMCNFLNFEIFVVFV